jgi:cell division protein FtsI (penicillin-binding protein 3)
MRAGLGDHRLRLIMAVTLLGFAAVVGRAVQVQAFDASSLAAQVVNQQQQTIPIQAQRGSIFSADGRTLAAEQLASSIVVSDRSLVKDRRLTAVAIARALGHRPVVVPHLSAKPTKKQRAFVARRLKLHRHFTAAVDSIIASLKHSYYIARGVDPSVGARIARMAALGRLPGISVKPEPARVYVQGALASQVLGYVDSFTLAGMGGLESQYDRYLAGHNGARELVQAPGNTVIGSVVTTPARQGRNMRLTIDSSVQAEVQTVLGQTLASSGAKAVTAIVMDPRNADILAMASAPGYDNNTAHQHIDRSANLAATMTYEPGSIFKVVTYGAALSEGLIYPGMMFHNLPYTLRFADKVIKDDVPRGPVTMSARECLAKSSNVCAAWIGGKMVGPAGMIHWMARFGLGHHTALDFPTETNGIVPSLANGTWSGSTTGTVPIGQGVSVSPIQMASIYQAVANGGVQISPRLVSSVQGVKLPAQTRHRVLTPYVADELVSMLKGVVSEPFGTGVLAKIPGYSIAGKTGTAQVPLNGRYVPGWYRSSFIGFFPASDPQVEIMVVVDHPTKGYFGGQVAAPAFAAIGKWYAHYAGIKPDQPVAGGK